jgi:surface antigen
MLAAKILALGLGGLTLAACSADSGPKEVGGAVSGAGTGTRFAGGTGGTAAGAFIGNRIGAALDDDDKRRAYAAQMQALETGPSGAPVAWRNPDSGRYGNVVPGPVYQVNGAPCRQYTHTVFIDGRPLSERGTACRNPDGTWKTAS